MMDCFHEGSRLDLREIYQYIVYALISYRYAKKFAFPWQVAARPGKAQRSRSRAFLLSLDSATLGKKISRRNAGLSLAIAAAPVPSTARPPLSTLPPLDIVGTAAARPPLTHPSRSMVSPAALPPLPVLPANTMEPESISDNLTTLPSPLPFFFFVSRWNSVEE